ncbi:hypothetical protein L5515_015652 [Caenorhabditis briggsae]|uniref:Uncharacterized protein n=1 Tax=Caenorhabditis briggsae TaxID=6238 RepID=A0AAE9DR45_CAEBR|nr:hypothetical protein L3Y34_019547 [Caenorhabditis briggsae]UMM20343.1 hypothetical protein L5515_015652 [Caenorhabditis briggsae]
MMTSEVPDDSKSILKGQYEDEQKLNNFRDRTYYKLSQKRHTIMIDMLPLKKPVPKKPSPKSPTMKSPAAISPIEIKSPTIQIPKIVKAKKEIRKYAPMMAQCLKIYKSASLG